MMDAMRNKASLVLIGAILAAAAVLVFLSGIGTVTDSDAGQGVFVIELRNSGFVPAEVTIPQGTEVVFRNMTDDDFWPASDPHPIHDYLAAFDPKEAISPRGEFRYRFDEPGTWPFHDHLHPGFRGEISVFNPAGVAVSGIDETCDLGEGRCFDEMIKRTVEERGIDAAYAAMTDAYGSGSLPRACHWTAHTIGEAAYDLFRSGKSFPISDATTYCGYGFYHGFLESLLRENPDVDYVLSFCEEVKGQLGDLGFWNCVHGIGHGFTEDPPAPEVWGDADAMQRPGIETCEGLFGDDFNLLNLCLTGVFTVPAEFAEHEEYGLSYDADDIFAYCRTQPYRYHKACFGEYAPKLSHELDWDLSRLPDYIADITDTDTRHLVIWVVSSVMVARPVLDGDVPESYVQDCYDGFAEKERDICLGALMQGIMTHAEPAKQHETGLLLCASPDWTQAGRAICYSELLRQMERLYAGPALLEETCGRVPEAYQRYCDPMNYLLVYTDPDFNQSEN